MTTVDSRDHADALVDDPGSTYDLIVLHRDRIVFHDHAGSPKERLRMCTALLTGGGTYPMVDAGEINTLVRSRPSAPPDLVLDSVAKLCRRWGVNIYASTTHKKPATPLLNGPAMLFSVITDYGPGAGRTIAEHFPSREARHAGLLQRVGTFFPGHGKQPGISSDDEQRLASLLGALLTPANIMLTESAWNETSGMYAPAGRLLRVL